MLLELSTYFSLLFPSSLHPPPTSILPPFYVSMGRTYKFFGFSISYTILNLPLSILCLPIRLFIPCTSPPIFSLALPTDNPPYDVYLCDSVSVLVVSLVCFCFCFLGPVVDSCEFVVILLFILLIIFIFF